MRCGSGSTFTPSGSHSRFSTQSNRASDPTGPAIVECDTNTQVPRRQVPALGLLPNRCAIRGSFAVSAATANRNGEQAVRRGHPQQYRIAERGGHARDRLLFAPPSAARAVRGPHSATGRWRCPDCRTAARPGITVGYQPARQHARGGDVVAGDRLMRHDGAGRVVGASVGVARSTSAPLVTASPGLCSQGHCQAGSGADPSNSSAKVPGFARSVTPKGEAARSARPLPAVDLGPALRRPTSPRRAVPDGRCTGSPSDRTRDRAGTCGCQGAATTLPWPGHFQCRSPRGSDSSG